MNEEYINWFEATDDGVIKRSMTANKLQDHWTVYLVDMREEEELSTTAYGEWDSIEEVIDAALKDHLRVGSGGDSRDVESW
jgi:hypothetical protein